jgi:hypothetical protein
MGTKFEKQILIVDVNCYIRKEDIFGKKEKIIIVKRGFNYFNNMGTNILVLIN